MAIAYDRTAPVLDNTTVDNIVDQSGEIDKLPSLSIEIDDRDIIKNLNQRINDSEAYWNDAKGFDLKNARNENERLHLGKVDEQGLYKYQKQYKENQIFVAEEAIVSYVTARIPGPYVIPASKEGRSKTFASDLEKAINCWSETVVNLEAMTELCVRHILNKRVSVIKFRYDKNYGEKGEIIAEVLNPEHVIFDKNAALGSNPAFICHVLKKSPDELINEFPDKETAILKELGIQRKTPKRMTEELAVREVWLTHHDEHNKPQEAVVWYFGNLVLNKERNPNWLYAKKDLNLISFPKKPFIMGNLVNYGDHMIDRTTPLEQAGPMQMYLMRRGRQIMENADKANGVLVIGTSSGLSKDDAQNLTGDPNQKLLVKDDQKSVRDVVEQLQAQALPEYVLQDKQDARMQVGNIMGAPSDFSGADTDESDPKVGIAIIKKDQATGRQDMMVRAIGRMLSQLYEYLVQMMAVWYTEGHQFTYDRGDGEFDFITMKRDLIEKGVRVKASKPANPDRSRTEAVILQLLQQKAISLLDAYRMLQLDNPQQLYDNWAKQQNDPMALARDALDVVDEAEAYVAYQDIMAGRPVDTKENPDKEYILALRKLMINDDFLKAKKSLQNVFIKYVSKCLDSYEERLALDAASSSEPDGEGLRPGAPLPNPNMIAGNQPGAMPPQNAMPPVPQPGMPPQAMPQPMTASSVFGGTPIPAPGQAIQPNATNPTSLPML